AKLRPVQDQIDLGDKREHAGREHSTNGDFSAAGSAYEKAIDYYKNAFALNGHAVTASDRSKSYWGTDAEVTWFPHAYVTEAKNEASIIAEQAREALERDELESAATTWKTALASQDKAVECNRLVTTADRARAQWKTLQLPPTWFVDVRQEGEAAREVAKAAAAHFYINEFQAAADKWTQAFEKTESPLRQHNSAKGSAKDAQRTWETAAEKTPHPFYDGIEEAMSELRTSAEAAQQHFDAGEFTKAKDAWEAHANSLAELIGRHDQAKKAANTVKASWDDKKLPSKKWHAAANAANQKARGEASTALKAFGEGDFDAAEEAWVSALRFWGQAINQHDAAVATLLKSAKDTTALPKARDTALAEYLKYEDASEETRSLQAEIDALSGPKADQEKKISLGGDQTMVFVGIP
ncbi:MAG: hypothetical protein QGF59_26385, partial [Pirellulaceae bacterium]|nr:hypothetical protein [Pirellulaceae bacterium]